MNRQLGKQSRCLLRTLHHLLRFAPIVLALSVIASCSISPSEPKEDISITQLGRGINPDVSGTKVVWQVGNLGPIVRSDVNDGGIDTIVEPMAGQVVGHPTIHGEQFAWNLWPTRSATSTDVVVAKSDGEVVRLTDDTIQDRIPTIADSYVTWERRSDQNGDIYAGRVRTGEVIAISQGVEDDIQPRIHGERVVWTRIIATDESGSPTQTQIRQHNLSDRSEVVISSESAVHGNPDVFGELVTWVKDGNVVLKNLAAEEVDTISTGGNRVSFPSISERWIVWEESRAVGSEIVAYEIQAEKVFQITDSGTDKGAPRVSEGVVVWHEFRQDGAVIVSVKLP